MRTVPPPIKLLVVVHGLMRQLSEDVLGGAQHRTSGNARRGDSSKSVKGPRLDDRQLRTPTDSEELPSGTAEVASPIPQVSGGPGGCLVADLEWCKRWTWVAISKSITSSIQVIPTVVSLREAR